jgi:3-carboxy-cis,cis-muconate cycloisomerase
MPQEHERGLGGWQAEWTAMPELVKISAGAARATADALEHLRFNSRRARENCSFAGGLPMAEAVAIALAPSLGKSEAHHVVERATARAVESNQSLEQVLLGDANVTAHLTAAQIKMCLEPESYLGSARVFVQNVLGRLSARL